MLVGAFMSYAYMHMRISQHCFKQDYCFIFKMTSGQRFGNNLVSPPIHYTFSETVVFEFFGHF